MNRILKSTLVKTLICVCFCALIALVYVPMYVFAAASTNTITIIFRDGYNQEQGYVEYSLNDGANWTKVTSNIDNQAIVVSGDNLRIRIVPKEGWQIDWSGTDYSENSEDPLHLNDQANSSIAGGLMGSNGYYVTASATSVALEGVEFRQSGGEPGQGGGDPAGFDGRAVVVWSCGTGVCYHAFDNIPDFADGNSTFYKDTSIEADNNPGTTFDVGAQYRAWYLTDTAARWADNYKIAKNITGDIDWTTVNPTDIINDGGAPDMREWEDKARAANACTEYTEECVDNYAATQGFIHSYQLRPVGEPDDKNAFVSYGDRNFKVVIYSSKFKGITTSDLSDLSYYPSEWVDPFTKVDQYDISDSTKDNPALLSSILLENKVKIRALNYNSFSISSIEPLDVPEDAVRVTKNGDVFELVFSSNFYDRVVFKVTDTNNKVSYVRVDRFTIDAWVKHDNNVPYLNADFYFDRERTYSDFTIKAKIVYKNGKSKNVTLTPHYGIDDGLGNITEAYESDEEHPSDIHKPAGKGLKKSTFEYKITNEEAENISKVYLNAEYKGSTSTTYAGAFAGSGKGVVVDFEERR